MKTDSRKVSIMIEVMLNNPCAKVSDIASREDLMAALEIVKGKKEEPAFPVLFPEFAVS